MAELIVALFIIGFLLVVAEAFVPGGILGILGGVVLIGGVVLSFREFGPGRGALIFAATAVGVTVFLGIGLKILPRTAIGRKILLSQTVGGSPRDPVAEEERRRLIGREGKALTDLRPAGRGLIAGRRWDVVSDGTYIDKGGTFRVIRVEGTRIVVSRIEGEEEKRA